MSLTRRIIYRLPWVSSALWRQAYRIIWAYKAWCYGGLDAPFDDWAMRLALRLFNQRLLTQFRQRKAPREPHENRHTKPNRG